MNNKRILLLSAYDAKSHRYWHQQLQQHFIQHSWHILSLKDRYFAWRMAGNALSFKASFHNVLIGAYDLIIATSMTDLSTLYALYPNLTNIPSILYFHENQFAYPANHNQKGLLEIQLKTIYAAMVADQLVFNSDYNQKTFLQGVSQFCLKMPDGLPAHLCHELKAKSNTLAVPIADDCQPLSNKTKPNQNLVVVWNHRWEHDKGPNTLLEVLRLCTNYPHIKFHIMGQQFRSKPPAMQEIIEKHAAQCLSIGFVESRDQYINVLQHADVVLSTALHDFQGIAMLEAVACGCTPIAPNRLVYPELYPPENLFPSAPEQPKHEAQSIVALLMNPQKLRQNPIHCQWQQLQPDYTQLLEKHG